MSATNYHGQDSAGNLLSNIHNLQAVFARFNAFRVDATEYACLKALVLFKSGTAADSSQSLRIEPMNCRMITKQCYLISTIFCGNLKLDQFDNLNNKCMRFAISLTTIIYNNYSVIYKPCWAVNFADDLRF